MALRAVIDTNVWISALLNPSGYPATMRKAFEKASFEVVISEPILQEISEVLSRPRIRDKYAIAAEDIEGLLILIEEKADHVLLQGSVTVCRDKDDDVVLETAITGNAEYIVSRDDDVKFDTRVSELLSRHGVSVLTVAKFLKLIK